MSDDCIFCKIARGAIPSHKIHEDSDVLAFLDIHPLARGHTLVIPKTHHVRLEDMPAGQAATLMGAVHRLVPRIRNAVNAPATTIAINNGKEAGQEVPHVHIHIVPRHVGDNGLPIHGLFTKRASVSAEELPDLAQKIRAPAATAH